MAVYLVLQRERPRYPKPPVLRAGRVALGLQARTAIGYLLVIHMQKTRNANTATTMTSLKGRITGRPRITATPSPPTARSSSPNTIQMVGSPLNSQAPYEWQKAAPQICGRAVKHRPPRRLQA